MKAYLVDTNLTDSISYDYRELFTEDIQKSINDYAHGREGADVSVEQEYAYKRFLREKEELPDEVTVLPLYDTAALIRKGYTVIHVCGRCGSDETGDGSAEKPFATPARGIAACGAEGYALMLHGGAYRLPAALEIDKAHSGSVEKPFLLLAAEGEAVELTAAGTLSASDFSPVDPANDEIAARIPLAAQKNAVVADLRGLGWSEAEIGSMQRTSRPIFTADGKQLDTARFPHNTGNDFDLLYFTKVDDSGSVRGRDSSRLYSIWMGRMENYLAYKAHGDGKEPYDWDKTVTYQGAPYRVYESREAALSDAARIDEELKYGKQVEDDQYGNPNIDHGFTIRLCANTNKKASKQISDEEIAAIAGWKSLRDGKVMYYGHVYEGWDYGHHFVRSIDLIRGKDEEGDYYALTTENGGGLGCGPSGNSPTGHNSFYLYNAPEAMEWEGEWFLHEPTGKLYMIKTANFETATLRWNANRIDLVSVTADNVIVDGISFRIGLKSGVHATGSTGCVVQRCHLEGLCAPAILLEETVRSAALYNELTKNRALNIQVLNRMGLEEGIPGFNVIQNNRITAPVNHQWGISVQGYRNAVTHNYLEETQISLGYGCGIVVEYNDLPGGNLSTSDAGLIYMSGYYIRGCHIRYNYLHSWKASGKGVYFDDLNLGNYAYGNVIDTTEAPGSVMRAFAYTSTGHDHVVANNFMIGRSSMAIRVKDTEGHEHTRYSNGTLRVRVQSENAEEKTAIVTMTYNGKEYTGKVDVIDKKTSCWYWGKVTDIPGYKEVELWYSKGLSDGDDDQMSLMLTYPDGHSEHMSSFADRINRSWLYFSDGCWLGYRFRGLSQGFYNFFSEHCTPGSELDRRYPELTNYVALMKEHLEERDLEGYRINPLEIYLRSLCANNFRHNVVLGVPRSYYGPGPNAHAEGVDGQGNPVTYRGTLTDVVEGFFDSKSEGYSRVETAVKAYQENPRKEDFLPLLRLVEAEQIKVNPDYISVEPVLYKAGIVESR